MKSRDDEVTKRHHGYQRISSVFETAQKPYYYGSKTPHVSAVFTTALFGPAPDRFNRALPPTTGKPQRMSAQWLGCCNSTSRLFVHLLDVEIAQVLRRLVRRGTLARNRAEEAMEDLIVIRVARYALSCSSIGSGS